MQTEILQKFVFIISPVPIGELNFAILTKKLHKKIIKSSSKENKKLISSNIKLVEDPEFKHIVEKITKRNKSKKYPDINKIPN